MKSKLALLLATLLFFNIILPVRVSAASIQDQSKPIFGLTADQVVEKYNQLTDQQKDQVLRSLGNTSIFANSLFGNIFNSTFGALDDAVKKLGDLFFQANGVVYKLGSSALAWISRLIDKVFNNDLTELNISQPVINDFYLNTRGLSFEKPPFFSMPHKFSFYTGSDSTFYNFLLPLPDETYIYANYYYNNNTSEVMGYNINYYSSRPLGVIVDDDNKTINFGYLSLSQGSSGYYFLQGIDSQRYPYYYFSGNSWVTFGGWNNSSWSFSYSGDYHDALLNYLNRNFVWLLGYYLKSSDIVTYVPLSNNSEMVNISNNTYYNYIYNIPVETPLNVTNIVSNTAINYDPIENLIQYLPDNYNIEQNFSVVNNYYISSGSAISGQAIDVNIVSPVVIDVRVINPEDFSTQIQNDVSQNIVNNYDLDINAGDLTSTITTVKNTAVNNLNEVAPSSGSSIGWVKNMFLVIPSDLMKILLTFLIVGIIVCVYHSR